MLKLPFSKISYEDIPMIEDPENENSQSKHYFCKTISSNYYSEFDEYRLPINYYALTITENLKYYIESSNPGLTLSDAIKILDLDFNHNINATIDELINESILIGTWLNGNVREGWYYFYENSDIIKFILEKNKIISRTNIYKNELLEQSARIMLHPDKINKILDARNIRFEDLNFEDL